MKNTNRKSPEISLLRQKAEDQLQNNHTLYEASPAEIDTLKLLHELEVHQIELEMQNEQLHMAMDQAAIAISLYDFSPTGYFALSNDGTICQLNLSGARLLGIDRSSMTNSNFKQFITEDTLLVFHDFFLKIFESLAKQTCEVRLKIQGNQSIFIHLEGFVSENEQMCLMTAVDITGHRQTAEALRESEERYRLLFESSLDAILLTSPNGGIFDANLSACHLFERTIEEIRRAGLSGIADSTDPRLVQAIEQRNRTGRFSGELTMVRKDGSKFPGEVSSAVFKDKYGITKTSMVIRDLTLRKQMEEDLRANDAKLTALIANIGDVISIIGPDGIIKYLSPNIEKYFGWNPEELIGTKDGWDLVYPGDIKMLQKKIPAIIGKDDATVTVEFRAKCKDGNWKWVELIAVNSINNNEIQGILTNYHDITERKVAEEALRESEAQLKELNATKDKFFSIIAHDLRNPFQAIIGSSNILAEQMSIKDYEGIEEYAEIIRDSSKRAMNLLMNLFQWSRSQTGRMNFSPESIEITSLINEVTELSNDSAKQKSIVISRELPHTITVFADKAMISSILRNLISNAIKFTNPNGTISISTTQNQKELTVAISDSGVGISKMAIEKLWRIEENSSTMGTQKETGTGLGLLLCKEFISKHGGNIWVESEPGKGSTFSFTIPILQ